MEQKELTVIYLSDYSAFRTSVAEQLHRYIVYRSDEGQFANEMIDLTHDLSEIHSGYTRLGANVGDQIRLDAWIIRRDAPEPEDRWVIGIRFSTPDVWSFDDHVVDVDLVEAYRSRLVQITRHALTIITSLHPNQQERLQCLLGLVKANDYRFLTPKFIYLNPIAVEIFINYMSDDQRQNELRDGIPPEKFKENPFAYIASLSVEANNEQILETLQWIDKRIMLSIQHWADAVKSGSNIYGSSQSGFYRLRDWVRLQQETPGTVYSCYAQSRPGPFGLYA